MVLNVVGSSPTRHPENEEASLEIQVRFSFFLISYFLILLISYSLILPRYAVSWPLIRRFAGVDTSFPF